MPKLVVGAVVGIIVIISFDHLYYLYYVNVSGIIDNLIIILC